MKDPLPAITLTLYCNGERMDVKTPAPDRNGRYEYYSLPDTYQGKPAVYTVVEEPLAGYQTSYCLANGQDANYADNGGTIINTKLPATGDRQPIGLWMGLAGVSALALIALLVFRKNRK